jgi:hypothetical protein
MEGRMEESIERVRVGIGTELEEEGDDSSAEA